MKTLRKIAVIGTGPLPIEGDAYIYSSSNRTWQVAEGLIESGHRVHVIAFRPTRTRNGERIADEQHREFRSGLLSHDSVEELLHFRNDEFLRGRIQGFGPDAVIGVNAFPAGRVGSLGLRMPFWADMNGFGMGEVQIRAYLTGNNGAVAHGWHDELPALEAADVFSAASGPQRYALIGQLASLGRLRAETCGYEFVHVIPNGREDPPPSRTPCALRDRLGPEAFLALWVGCYNFQFDTDSLFEGLEKAMESNPAIHFVSTGGQVDGHNERSFAVFRAKADASRFRDRFHFVGWLPWEEFDSLMRASDVGVSMDIPCYETEVGARNRLTEMMRVGLPAINTQGPEIAVDIGRWDAGWIIPPRRSDSFAEALLTAARSPGERKRKADNARKVFEERYTLAASLAPLLAWAENPVHSPDHGLPRLLPRRNAVGATGQATRTSALASWASKLGLR